MIQVRVHLESLNADDLPRPDRLTVLRGQLTLIRTRAEGGIPISVESIARAEQLARGLEAEELTA